MFVLALFVSLFLVTPSLAANVYWTAHNGNQAAVCTSIKSTGTATAPGVDPGTYGTISRAAECATVAGDVVWVKNTGIYTGNNHRVKTTDGTTITAAGLKSGTSDTVRTTITGDINSTRPLIQSQGGWYCTDGTTLAHPAARSYITIKHLKIDGGTVNDGLCATAIMWIAGEHVTIDDIEIFNAYNVPIYASTNSGGTIMGQFLQVKNSIIHDAGADGQGVGVYSGGNDSIIEHNEFYNLRGTMIETYSSLWATDRPTIRYNYFHDQRAAFQAGFSAQCSFIALNGNGAVVHDNIIVNNTSSCPTADPASYGILVGFRATASANIYNNLIINPLGHGITVNSPVPNGAVHIKNNIFWNIGQLALMLQNGPTVDATHNACVTSQNCAASNKVTLTALTTCTVSLVDFHQNTTSLCINTGVNIPPLDLDYDGIARPQGTSTDIGPYEFIGGTPDITPPAIPQGFQVQ